MKHEFNLYEGKEDYIFVSYSHKDKERVFPVLKKMMESGYRIWFDEGIHPGSQWPEIVAGHLDKCTVFMVFISDHYMQSQNCIRELHFAVSRNKSLISIMLQPVQLTPGVEMQLCVSQAVRHYEFPTEELFYKTLNTSVVLGMCQAKERPVKEAEKPDLQTAAKQNEELPKQEKVKADKPHRKKAVQNTRKEKDEKQKSKKGGRKKILLTVLAAAVVLIAVGSAGIKKYNTIIFDGQKYSRNTLSLTIKDKTVTEDLVKELNNFSDLSGLIFENCTFEDGALTQLPQMQNLSQLRLRNCKNVNDLEFISRYESLYTLEIKDCGIQNEVMNSIDTASDIQELEVSGNPELSDLDWIVKFSNLFTLKLENNAIERADSVSELEQLRTLSLAGNKIKEISVPVQSLRIRTLDLSDNQISDFSGLSDMTVLQEFDIAGNGYEQTEDKKGLECISKSAETLQIADLSGNRLSGSDLSQLLKNCSQLLEVYLDGNQNIDNLDMLAKAKDLKKITAKGCGLKEIGEIQKCQQLNVLDLSDNEITSLKGMPKFVSTVLVLDLSKNQLTDITGLTDSVSYTKLILYDNKLQPAENSELLAKLKGSDIGISYAEGLIPEAVSGFVSCYVENVPADQKVKWEDSFGGGCNFKRMQTDDL